MEPYLIALGYGGTIEAAGNFEWNFRVYLGAEEAGNSDERAAFLASFRESAQDGGSYAILVEDYDSPLVQTFMEYGKRALAENPDLWLFLLIEDSSNPEVQHKILLEPDPAYELFMPNQIRIDIQDVPRDVLLWLNRRLQLRFYEKDDEVMVEFPVEDIQ